MDVSYQLSWQQFNISLTDFIWNNFDKNKYTNCLIDVCCTCNNMNVNII